MAHCGTPWVIGRGVEVDMQILIRVNKKKINRVILIKTRTRRRESKSELIRANKNRKKKKGAKTSTQPVEVVKRGTLREHHFSDQDTEIETVDEMNTSRNGVQNGVQWNLDIKNLQITISAV